MTQPPTARRRVCNSEHICLCLFIWPSLALFTHHNYPPHFEEVGENSLRSRKSRKRDRMSNFTSFVRSFVLWLGDKVYSVLCETDLYHTIPQLVCCSGPGRSGRQLRATLHRILPCHAIPYHVGACLGVALFGRHYRVLRPSRYANMHHTIISLRR